MTLSKIINVQHSSQAADLIGGVPNGPVQGYHLNNDSQNQSWTFINIGGKTFQFKNGTSGTFARVAHPGDGSNVIGGAPESWNLNPITSPISSYQIATPDGRYIWRLTGPHDHAPIILVDASYSGEDALWTYRPA